MESANPRNRSGLPWMFMLSGLGVAAIVMANRTSHAQSFSSGSDGSDGALTIPTNAGTIVFDPVDTARWGRVLDPDSDGVYNFTTITIGSGSTLKLQGDKVNRPVYWLASGAVVNEGTLESSGAGGDRPSDLGLRRQVSVPGAGGYSGGAGGLNSVPATPGEGPGGGAAGVAPSGVVPGSCGKGGTFTGNPYLIPLIGGSGGGGALESSGVYEGGGAGGGAILIASSTSITVTGKIAANGGGGSAWNIASGGGSGGAIRLVAPTIGGGGRLEVNGGGAWGSGGWGGCNFGGSPGWVRLEAFVISFSGIVDPSGAVATRGSPVDPTTLRPTGSIRVTAIDGIPVAANPSGSFVLPDVTISKSGPVNVDIQATGIPPGTVVTLQVYPQTPTDIQTVNLPTAQATLSGTQQSSTATATFTFPYGFSRGFVRASWTQ
jgi:hypothetical protein